MYAHIVIGNAHERLGLTVCLGKRDGSSSAKGWPALLCDAPQRSWQTGDLSPKNTHNPPQLSSQCHFTSNGNNYHSSFPMNSALALPGTSQTLTTSATGTGNQYIHSQPGTWGLWGVCHRILDKTFNFYLQNVENHLALTTYKPLSGVVMFVKLPEVLKRKSPMHEPPPQPKAALRMELARLLKNTTYRNGTTGNRMGNTVSPCRVTCIILT